jgi:SWIM zinc finger
MSELRTDRIGRAIRMSMKEKKVNLVGGSLYSVESESTRGKTYQVKIDESCSCPDFQKRGIPCKHILLTQLTLAGVEAKAE